MWREDPQLCYATLQDILELEEEDDACFVAIKAPFGTTLNVTFNVESQDADGEV